MFTPRIAGVTYRLIPNSVGGKGRPEITTGGFTANRDRGRKFSSGKSDRPGIGAGSNATGSLFGADLGDAVGVIAGYGSSGGGMTETIQANMSGAAACRCYRTAAGVAAAPGGRRTAGRGTAAATSGTPGVAATIRISPHGG